MSTFDGKCNQIGFNALAGFNSLKTLAAAIAIITLSVFSLILSFNLGESLNAQGGWWLYPWLLAAISLLGFYLAGFIVVKAISIPVRGIAAVWLVLIVALDVFAAWTMLCAADHKREESANHAKIGNLEQQLATQTALVSKWASEADSTKWHYWKEKHAERSNEAAERAQDIQAQLDAMNAETYDAIRAVFYVTPVFRDAPEEWMVAFRAFVALVAALTPFVGTGLVVAHLASMGYFGQPSTTPPRPKKRKPESNNQADRSEFYAQWLGGSTAPGAVTATAPEVVKAEAPKHDNVVSITAPQPNRSPSRTAPKPGPARDRSGAVSGAVTKISLPANIEERIKDDEQRYQVVEYLVRRGAVKPSTRAIKALGIGSTNCQHYIERMVKNGVVVKGGQGKASKLVDSMQLAEPVEKFEQLIAA